MSNIKKYFIFKCGSFFFYLNKIVIPVFLFFIFSTANALVTELGVSYSYKKSTFDENNNIESQSTTGSVSFYVWERVAIEMSYTNGLYTKKEMQPNMLSAVLRTTTQYTDIYGADLILVLADRNAMVQPYLKAGAAQVSRRQVVQDGPSNPSWEIKYSGLSPSYGAGLKILLSQTLSLKASYDIIQTPVDNNTKVEEISGRIGLGWSL